jgi:hypothetical protein
VCGSKSQLKNGFDMRVELQIPPSPNDYLATLRGGIIHVLGLILYKVRLPQYLNCIKKHFTLNVSPKFCGKKMPIQNPSFFQYPNSESHQKHPHTSHSENKSPA